MSNKVVKIGSTSAKKSSLEDEIIYSDISMSSPYKTYSDPTAEQRRIGKSVNVRAVQNSLDNIFSWIPGERILNPEFGTKLHEYLYEGITQYNEEMIVAEIKSCIARWEPRVVVT